MRNLNSILYFYITCKLKKLQTLKPIQLVPVWIIKCSLIHKIDLEALCTISMAIPPRKKKREESRGELRICSIRTGCSLLWCIWQQDLLNQVGYWLSQAWSAPWSAGSYKQHLTCDIFQTLQTEWQRAPSDPTSVNVFLPDFSWDLEEHIRFIDKLVSTSVKTLGGIRTS